MDAPKLLSKQRSCLKLTHVETSPKSRTTHHQCRPAFSTADRQPPIPHRQMERSQRRQCCLAQRCVVTVIMRACIERPVHAHCPAHTAHNCCVDQSPDDQPLDRPHDSHPGPFAGTSRGHDLNWGGCQSAAGAKHTIHDCLGEAFHAEARASHGMAVPACYRRPVCGGRHSPTEFRLMSYRRSHWPPSSLQ